MNITNTVAAEFANDIANIDVNGMSDDDAVATVVTFIEDAANDGVIGPWVQDAYLRVAAHAETFDEIIESIARDSFIEDAAIAWSNDNDA